MGAAGLLLCFHPYTIAHRGDAKETAALRDCDPAHVGYGSILSKKDFRRNAVSGTQY
jgi:hypothetical protein